METELEAGRGGRGDLYASWRRWLIETDAVTDSVVMVATKPVRRDGSRGRIPDCRRPEHGEYDNNMEGIGLQFHVCENLLSTRLPRHAQELTRQTYWISARGRGYG